MEIKEMPLEEKYDKLYDQYLLTEAMNYALHKELGVLDKYMDLYVKVMKKRLPGLLGVAFKALKAIAPGKAFKQLTDQSVYMQQMLIPPSNIELTRVSDREATTRIRDCPVLKKMRDVVKKAGLDIDPKSMCEMDAKIMPLVTKEFGIDATMELEENGCITTHKLK